MSHHHCHNLSVLKLFTSSFPHLHLTQQLLPGQHYHDPQHWSVCITESALLLQASSGFAISQWDYDITPCTSVCTAADPEGVCYKALGFSPGFAPDAPVSAYLKLLPMLAGIGSPGTIQEVPLHTCGVATCLECCNMLVVLEHAYNMHAMFPCCHGQQQPSVQLTCSAA